MYVQRPAEQMTSEERIQRNTEEQKPTKKEVSGTSGKCGELERTWAVTQSLLSREGQIQRVQQRPKTKTRTFCRLMKLRRWPNPETAGR